MGRKAQFASSEIRNCNLPPLLAFVLCPSFCPDFVCTSPVWLESPLPLLIRSQDSPTLSKVIFPLNYSLWVWCSVCININISLRRTAQLTLIRKKHMLIVKTFWKMYTKCKENKIHTHYHVCCHICIHIHDNHTPIHTHTLIPLRPHMYTTTLTYILIRGDTDKHIHTHTHTHSGIGINGILP